MVSTLVHWEDSTKIVCLKVILIHDISIHDIFKGETIFEFVVVASLKEDIKKLILDDIIQSNLYLWSHICTSFSPL